MRLKEPNWALWNLFLHLRGFNLNFKSLLTGDRGSSVGGVAEDLVVVWSSVVCLSFNIIAFVYGQTNLKVWRNGRTNQLRYLYRWRGHLIMSSVNASFSQGTRPGVTTGGGSRSWPGPGRSRGSGTGSCDLRGGSQRRSLRWGSDVKSALWETRRTRPTLG